MTRVALLTSPIVGSITGTKGHSLKWILKYKDLENEGSYSILDDVITFSTDFFVSDSSIHSVCIISTQGIYLHTITGENITSIEDNIAK